MSVIYPELAAYLETSSRALEAIPGGRKRKLSDIALFVEECLAEGLSARLTFICTHNSRRSHMAQIWAQTAAARFGIARVETFSGGTEATSFDPRAVEALRRCGFRIDEVNGGGNPTYLVYFSDDQPPIEAFSKVFDAPPNPRRDFCAVLTCSEADSCCPVVIGSAKRVAIPYDDPKQFDGTGTESIIYDERCRLISVEMLYLFSHVGRD